MMRLARKAALLVAFFLLTSTATAYAECAECCGAHQAVSLAAGAWEEAKMKGCTPSPTVRRPANATKPERLPAHRFGGLMSYRGDLRHQFRRAALYVDNLDQYLHQVGASHPV
jgi:hypothetical protein